jgi:hypothetical protein
MDRKNSPKCRFSLPQIPVFQRLLPPSELLFCIVGSRLGVHTQESGDNPKGDRQLARSKMTAGHKASLSASEKRRKLILVASAAA